MTAKLFDPGTGDTGRLDTNILSLAMTNDVIAGIIADITASLNEHIVTAVDKAVRREFHALALACANCPGGPAGGETQVD